MRAFACVLAASVLVGAPVIAAPHRVASLNLCTDELLLMLGRPDQIASVTHLSQSAAESVLWQSARRYRRNDGSLLSVVSHRPDLVLTMGAGAGDKAGIARRLGTRVVALPFPKNLADIEASVSIVADLLGRPQAGQKLLQQLAALKRTAPRRRIDAVWLGGGGRSVASSGLAAQWMGLAGLAQRKLPGDRVGLEELLLRPPRLLLRSDYRAGQYSAEQGWLGHRLAKGAKSRTVRTDGRRWTCMGPTLIDEIVRLRRAAA